MGFLDNIDIITVLISMISSGIIAIFAVRYEYKINKNEKIKDMRIELLNRVSRYVQNGSIVNPDLVNEIENSKFIKNSDKSELVKLVKEYNSLIISFTKLIKNCLIDLYLRQNTEKPDITFMEHQFDDITNEHLNKLATYLTQDDWYERALCDFNTLNFFKRQVKNTSDGFELYGIELLIAAIHTKDSNFGNFIDEHIIEDGHYMYLKLKEKSNVIIKLINKNI